jgi:hypothetical protein
MALFLNNNSVRGAALIRAVLPALLAVVTLTLGAAEAHAKYGFNVTPKVGTRTTAFTVTFRAPFTVDGMNTEYLLEAVGPPACASVFDFSGAARRGRRVTLHLTPQDDVFLPSWIHHRWCRGAYVGYVYYQAPGMQPNRVIGYFSIGVGRSPVKLGV